MFKLFYFFIHFTSLIHLFNCASEIKVWGPGLKPHLITMPARYFFIESLDSNFESLNGTTPIFNVIIEGISKANKPCRIWSNILDRKDGSYIVRYKLYEACKSITINIKHENVHVAESPYIINHLSYSDDCNCPKTMQTFLASWECGPTLPARIKQDLDQFNSINWNSLRQKIIEKFHQPHSVSLCHYIIKSNQVHRKCYGKYVGFNMFMDSILLSLARKIHLPDLEFFVNLGDWPLVDKQNAYPIFSWCGSTERRDIVLPTYDITESTLENMGKVMLDMLSVQGNVEHPWKFRKSQAFWRGRDSNQHRLDLVDISRRHPDLFNVSLTNFFFFRDKEEQYGPRSAHVSFFKFFDYKYQLAIDGTVASYRFPYLLAGGSLVFKQDSHYYEHFYSDLKPNVHYIPIKRDLSDLVDKLQWAIDNDEKAQKIAENGAKYANHNLLPKNIFCYHAQLLNEFAKKITSDVNVLDGMEMVNQIKEQTICDCKNNIKDEL